jgi:hypothetical protein
MWPVTGKTVDPEPFQPFKPLQVLYDFEGPRIFTHRDREGELFLAYWCDEDERATRFIVVPFTAELVRRLEQGELDVRAALEQPRCWLLEVSHDEAHVRAWRVQLADLPADALPQPGTMLLPSLGAANGARRNGTEGRPLLRVSGRVREVDRDRRSFDLRGIPGQQTSKRFLFEDGILADVLDALREDKVVTVVSVEPAPGTPPLAVSVVPQAAEA